MSLGKLPHIRQTDELAATVQHESTRLLRTFELQEVPAPPPPLLLPRSLGPP